MIKYSIVIPHKGKLTHALQSLEELSFLKNFAEVEVIFVDNSNGENLSIRSQFPFIKYFKHPKIGRSYARNFGAAQASGQWIIFLDSDCILTEIALKNLISTIESFGRYIDVFQSKHIAIKPKSNFRKLNSFQIAKGGMETLFQKKVSALDLPTLNTSCLAIRKRTFFAIKGFETKFVRYEDRHLGHQLLLKNYIVMPLSQVTVYKIVDKNFGQKILHTCVDFLFEGVSKSVLNLPTNEIQNYVYKLSKFAFDVDIKDPAMRLPLKTYKFVFNGNRFKFNPKTNWRIFINAKFQLCIYDAKSKKSICILKEETNSFLAGLYKNGTLQTTSLRKAFSQLYLRKILVPF